MARLSNWLSGLKDPAQRRSIEVPCCCIVAGLGLMLPLWVVWLWNLIKLLHSRN